jgi:hypothetical protein
LGWGENQTGAAALLKSPNACENHQTEPSWVNETKHGAAERMRRFRDRRKRGTRVYRIEVAEDEIEALLVGTRNLHPASADNPKLVEAALQRMIDTLVVRYLSRDA